MNRLMIAGMILLAVSGWAMLFAYTWDKMTSSDNIPSAYISGILIGVVALLLLLIAPFI